MRTVLAEQIVDLLLLDLKLFAEDGMASRSVCARIRHPIIIVSAAATRRIA